MRSHRHYQLTSAAAAAAVAVLAPPSALASRRPPRLEYEPGRVVVAYDRPQPPLSVAMARAGVRLTREPGQPRLIALPRGESVARALAALRSQPNVAYAVPNFIAHVADAGSSSTPTGTGATRASAAPTTTSTAATTTSTTPTTTTTTSTTPTTTTTTTTTTSTTPTTTSTTPTPTTPPPKTWIPNDRGRSHVARGWEAMQWNFLAGEGVNAPQAWANLIADHAPGARGVTVAVLDTGVAYRNWRKFKLSPEFKGTEFVHPYDFIAGNRFPLDREGHGTFVAGTIAEATNNGFSLTGLAYNASLMPIRILDAQGNGDAATIAKGIRYAVTHGAQVINLSLEFTPDVTAADIPEIISAIAFAHRRGVVVVAAAGNEGINQIDYPARAAGAIAVGATTRDRCLADYSDTGRGLDLVAPGGGDDTAIVGDANCHPQRSLPSINQLSFTDPTNPDRFGYPSGMFGTSMASPHVAAAAAMVIASGVLGRHPSPDEIKARLEDTARPLGSTHPNSLYGYGLIDIGAATARVVAVTTGHSQTR